MNERRLLGIEKGGPSVRNWVLAAWPTGLIQRSGRLLAANLPLERFRLLPIREQFLKPSMDHVGAERFADEHRSIREVAVFRPQIPGGDENFYFRPTLRCFASKVETVAASGHLYVREQYGDLILVRLQGSDRFRYSTCLKTLEASVGKDVADIHQDLRVVIDRKCKGSVDIGHPG